MVSERFLAYSAETKGLIVTAILLIPSQLEDKFTFFAQPMAHDPYLRYPLFFSLAALR